MRWLQLSLLVCVILLHCCVAAYGQIPLSVSNSAEMPPYRSYGVAWPESPAPNQVDKGQGIVGVASPMIPDPESYPNRATPAPPAAWEFCNTRFDATWLPRIDQPGLGIVDAELATTLKLDALLAPIMITPYAAAHAWYGPSGVALPTEVYDLSVEFAWRPRVAEWLFIDLAGTPGLYTDFKDVTGRSFQLRGRALGIVAFSEKLQVAAGAMYVNRNLTKVLPAGGVIWNPSEGTRLFLIFPQPKISHRFTTFGDVQLWAYLAGEFGGGRWEAQATAGVNDSIDYTDWRLIVGVESVYRNRWRAHADVGYVFNRRVNFASTDTDYRPTNTVMVRAGLRF